MPPHLFVKSLQLWVRWREQQVMTHWQQQCWPVVCLQGRLLAKGRLLHREGWGVQAR